MTYILKCSDCGDVVEFEEQVIVSSPGTEHARRSGQSMYGVAYVAGARHEQAHRGQSCTTGAARCLRLIGVISAGVRTMFEEPACPF